MIDMKWKQVALSTNGGGITLDKLQETGYKVGDDAERAKTTMDFNIEDVKLTSKDADPKTIVDGRTKYPFKSLQPGKCFYVPPETKAGQWRKAFTALWAYNRRHKAKLTFKRMPDGRLCIFYPLDLEFDESRPSQFEFVSWLTTLTEATSLDLRDVNQPHETLAEWFDEFVAKSGKAMKYEINESTQIMTIEVL